jgi:hypothetical protein
VQIPIPPGTPPPSDSAASLHQAAAAVVRAVAAAEDRSEGSVVDAGRVIAAGPGTPPGGCNGDGVEVRLWLEDAAEAGAWYDAASGSDSGVESPSPRMGSPGEVGPSFFAGPLADIHCRCLLCSPH